MIERVTFLIVFLPRATFFRNELDLWPLYRRVKRNPNFIELVSFGFPIDLIGAGAYSGATAADFNRIPFYYPKGQTLGPEVRLLHFQRTIKYLADFWFGCKKKIKKE